MKLHNRTGQNIIVVVEHEGGADGIRDIVTHLHSGDASVGPLLIEKWYGSDSSIDPVRKLQIVTGAQTAFEEISIEKDLLEGVCGVVRKEYTVTLVGTELHLEEGDVVAVAEPAQETLAKEGEPHISTSHSTRPTDAQVEFFRRCPRELSILTQHG